MSPQLLDSQFATLEEPQASEHPIVVSIDAPTRAQSSKRSWRSSAFRRDAE
jgi:gluconate kinase